MKYNKQTVVAVSSFLICIFLLWYGDIDILERGTEQSFGVGISVILSGILYFASNEI